MPFDQKTWQTLAKQGDVAGLALYTSIAIRNLNLAILAMQVGEDPSEHSKEALEMANELTKMYRDLSGYVPDGE